MTPEVPQACTAIADLSNGERLMVRGRDDAVSISAEELRVERHLGTA